MAHHFSPLSPPSSSSGLCAETQRAKHLIQFTGFCSLKASFPWWPVNGGCLCPQAVWWLQGEKSVQWSFALGLASGFMTSTTYETSNSSAPQFSPTRLVTKIKRDQLCEAEHWTWQAPNTLSSFRLRVQQTLFCISLVTCLLAWRKCGTKMCYLWF